LKIIFNADAARIGIVSGVGKTRRQGKSRQKFVTGKRYKRAIITLKKGSEAELVNATSAMPQTGAYTAEKAE
jgi:ribosomal protein L23